MKINFYEKPKMAILKKTQLIRFLKKRGAPDYWSYCWWINWIKMLQVLLMKQCNLNFQVFVGNAEQLIAVSVYQSSLRLSLHTFLFVLRDNKRFVIWHERPQFLLVSYLFLMLYVGIVHQDSF